MSRPKFVIIAVSTIDGKIAKHSKHMTDWSSKEDKGFLHKLLGRCDAVIVGNNTYKVAQGPLSKRNCIVFTGGVEGIVERGPNLVLLNPEKVDIAEYCAGRGYQNVVVLGGTKAFNYFLGRGLVDEIFLTIEPLVFGSGIQLFDSGDSTARFKLASLKRLNKKGTLLLHYRKK